MGRREPFTKSDLPFTESDLREQKKKTAKQKRPKIGLTDAELRTLTQQVGVPPNNRAVVMKEC